MLITTYHPSFKWVYNLSTHLFVVYVVILYVPNFMNLFFFKYRVTCCPWSHGLRPRKKLLVSVAVPPAPVRVPGQKPLATSVASVMSVASEWWWEFFFNFKNNLGLVYSAGFFCRCLNSKIFKMKQLQLLMPLWHKYCIYLTWDKLIHWPIVWTDYFHSILPSVNTCRKPGRFIEM